MKHTKTKVMKNAFESYNISIGYYGYRRLNNCYDTHSIYKSRAEQYCLDLLRQYNGEGFTIIGHNCMTFSVGFIGEIENRKAFFYITRDYDRYIFLDEL